MTTPHALYYAAWFGDLGEVRSLVSKHGCDIMARDSDGRTPLHIAALAGREEVVRELVTKYRCPVDCVSSDGRTPLHLAAKWGHRSIVRLLLAEFGADASVTDSNSDTALDIATSNGHKSTIGIIAEFSCSLHAELNRGSTPIFMACEGGHLDVVRKLASEHGCDLMARDSDGNTPLHIAALSGREEVVRELVTEYRCPVDCVSCNERTPLHLAAWKGHSSVVRLLLDELEANASCIDKNGDTALDLAALDGHVNLIISEFKCSPHANLKLGRSPFHIACSSGHLDVVKNMISEYGCDVMALDSNGSTPLHIAALSGREEVVRELVSNYKCPVDCVCSLYGETPLHKAAKEGHGSVVRLLLVEFGADAAIASNYGVTALDLAALNGHVNLIVSCFERTAHVKLRFGRTPLHMACEGGHLDVVRILVSEHGCDIMARDSDGDTPLHIAALAGREEVVKELITEFGCTPHIKGKYGNTPLHNACGGGHLDVVRILVSEHGCDIMARDSDGDTPLNIAALAGREEVVRELITEFGCTPHIKGEYGRTPLHNACGGGHLDVVRKLVSEHGCDIMARDSDGDTPLNIAALAGREEVVRELITEFGCTPHIKGEYGRTPLHNACGGGHLDVVKILVSEHRCDITARDSNGNTPLHIAALSGREEVVRELVTMYRCPVDCVCSDGSTPLHLAAWKGHSSVVNLLIFELNASATLKDKAGHTALFDAIKNGHLQVVSELVRHNCDPSSLDAKTKQLSKLSAKILSKGSLSKVFAVGDPQVGKSTVIEALKGETWFTWDVKVVPPHTAGIVPVAHQSSLYGRVIFYDFAGDREYYSSHAAVLEKLMGGSSNTFLLVFDLSRFDSQSSEEEQRIFYWLTFLSYSCRPTKTQLKVVLVGSHADILQSQGKDPEQVVNKVFTNISGTFYTEFPQTSVEMAGYAALDCCKTKSKGLQQIRNHLKQIQLSSLSEIKELSVGASILMGVLERDGQVFKPACQLSSLVQHIKLNKIYLPSEAEQLHCYLKELDAYGVVLLLEGGPVEEEWVVLDIIGLLGTVHKKLFSGENFQPDSLSNLGIIPDSRLQSLFPEIKLPVLKGCLKLLQYCQEIDDPQVITKVLEVSPSPTMASGSCLFFPALLQVKRGDLKWGCAHSSLYCLGWYIDCSVSRSCDFFPPRFLHVLLLRLAFTFALPKTSSHSVSSASDVDVYSRKCTLWKNGIHWIAATGVETVVEVVKHSRGVVVMVRGSSDMEVECADVLASVVRKVMEVKCEFCHTLVASAFLVVPEDVKQPSVPETDELQLFETSQVQEDLWKGSPGSVSQNGRGFLRFSELHCLLSQTALSKLQ